MKENGVFVDMVIDLAAAANCFCVAMVRLDASICQDHQIIAHLFPLEKNNGSTSVPRQGLCRVERSSLASDIERLGQALEAGDFHSVD